MNDVAAVAAAVAADQREEGPAHESLESAFRAFVPRMNSSAIAASTKAENVYAISPGVEEPAPSTIRTTPTASETRNGHRNVFPSPRSDARRQAISGPIPIRRSSGSPKMRRKKS